MSHQLELADFFQELVLGPRVGGRFEDYLLDVHKASFLKPSSVLVIVGYRPVVHFGRIAD